MISILDYSSSWMEVDGFLAEHYEGSVAWRINIGGKKIIFAPDVANVSLKSAYFHEFCKGADLLIIDSLYAGNEINPESEKKHSSMETVLAFAQSNNVKRVLHFHHSPLKDDAELEKLEARCKLMESDAMKVDFAKEGMEIFL